MYIFCRQEKKPYMLIDFSDQLSVNIFTLGAVYIQVWLGADYIQACQITPSYHEWTLTVILS